MTTLPSKKPAFLRHLLLTLAALMLVVGLAFGVSERSDADTATATSSVVHVGGLQGCTPTQGQQAKTVVMDVAMVACLILNAELSDARVAEVCQVSNILLPDIINILTQQRQATALAAERLSNQKMAAMSSRLAAVPCDNRDAGVGDGGRSK